MRGIVRFILTLIIVLVIAWVGLWWYAQGRLQSGFQNWADTQATAGWKITYDSIHRGTVPTAATVTIANLVLTPPADVGGQTGSISLPSLTLRIDAASPLVFHTDLPNKIALNVANSFDAALDTGSIALSENLDPAALFNKTVYPFRGGDFAARDIDVLASSGSLLVLHIDSLTSHADLDLQATASQTAMSTTTSLDGISLSPILTKIASIPFDGKITHLIFGGTFSGPVPGNLSALADQFRALPHEDEADQQKIVIPIIHKWASAGGTGNVSLSTTIGGSSADADANVKFDANLQPGGTADLTAYHLDAFTAAIIAAYPQVQPTIAGVEAQLTPYITTSGDTGQTLAMHITYGPGAVSINGTQVATQPPLDWNALENPVTPAVAPAAPDGTNSGQ